MPRQPILNDSGEKTALVALTVQRLQEMQKVVSGAQASLNALMKELNQMHSDLASPYLIQAIIYPSATDQGGSVEAG